MFYASSTFSSPIIFRRLYLIHLSSFWGPLYKKIAIPLFNKLGINYFAHAISYHNGNATALSTNLDVSLHWIIEQYTLPGTKMSSGNYFVPYMDNAYPISYRKALSEIFSIDNMFIIIESHKNCDEFFTFSTEPDNHKIINYYFNNLSIFKKFIANYKIQANNIIKLATQTQIQIPLSASFSTRDLGILSSEEKNSLIEQLAFKRIPINGSTYLTAREVDCLVLCSQNKSAKETAKALTISNRTVEMHLENAKEKLGCKGKSQLLAEFFKILERYLINKDFIKSY